MMRDPLTFRETAVTATAEPPTAPPAGAEERRRAGRWIATWARYGAANRDRGMSTAEYAVGTIAACAFAALLFKVVSSPEVQEMLKALIDRALKTTT
nr:DUF4244 domain-containing protein [Nonomuraea sp. 3-1Str]